MKEIRIGIIGGCLATLNDVKKSELFYNRIKNNFKEDLKISFSLGSYNDITEVKEEIIRLNEKKDIQCLIFQIRPYVYLKNCRFYLKTSVKNMMNPLIFNKNNFHLIESLDKKLTKPIHERIAHHMQNKTNSNLKKNISFYNINLFLGYIFKINNAMEKYYVKQIELIQELCNELNIKLIVHGPVTRTSHKMEPILLKSLTLKFKNNFKDLKYTETNETYYEGKNVLFSDGEHVNANGHKMLADYLIKELESVNEF